MYGTCSSSPGLRSSPGAHQRDRDVGQFVTQCRGTQMFPALVKAHKLRHRPHCHRWMIAPLTFGILATVSMSVSVRRVGVLDAGAAPGRAGRAVECARSSSAGRGVAMGLMAWVSTASASLAVALLAVVNQMPKHVPSKTSPAAPTTMAGAACRSAAAFCAMAPYWVGKRLIVVLPLDVTE